MMIHRRNKYKNVIHNQYLNSYILINEMLYITVFNINKSYLWNQRETKNTTGTIDVLGTQKFLI